MYLASKIINMHILNAFSIYDSQHVYLRCMYHIW